MQCVSGAPEEDEEKEKAAGIFGFSLTFSFCDGLCEEPHDVQHKGEFWGIYRDLNAVRALTF